MTTPPLSINGNRLWQSLMDLAQIGATPKGGNCRLALTALDGQGRDLVTGWMREAGMTVNERTLTVHDFMGADEIFSTGNHSKVVPIVRIEDRSLQPGPVAARAREAYWDFAHPG